MQVLGDIGGAANSLFGYIIPFLFVLTVVVFVHELGHFLVGRWCGVGVKAFSIGFGPELVGFNDRHGTRWKLCAVPLGGYVKFAGDLNATSVPDQGQLARMSDAERAISFHHKSVWQRAAIVAAGPIANFLLATVLFTGTIYVNGRYIVPARVETVMPNSAADEAGFKPGDLVQSIDGRPVSGFAEMQRLVSTRAGEPLNFLIERGGRQVELTATPRAFEDQTPFGKQRIGRLGIQGTRDASESKHVTYGLGESLQQGAFETYYVVERTFDYIGKLVRGRESAEQLSGPIRIAQVSGQVASLGGLGGLTGLIAVLSVSIGLINLFPIPLLDGGHLLFYGIEALRGRPLSDRAQEIGFRIGLALVLMLMLFATWNDIVHLGSAWSGRGT